MNQPNVSNVLKDEKAGITYNVMAYKKLSQEEIIHSIRYYHSQKKGKKLKKGMTVTIITILGFDQ